MTSQLIGKYWVQRVIHIYQPPLYLHVPPFHGWTDRVRNVGFSSPLRNPRLSESWVRNSLTADEERTAIQVISHPMESCRVLTGCVLHLISLSPPPCPADNITCDAKKTKPTRHSAPPPLPPSSQKYIYVQYIHIQSDMFPNYLRNSKSVGENIALYYCGVRTYLLTCKYRNAVSIACLNGKDFGTEGTRAILFSPPLPRAPPGNLNKKFKSPSQVGRVIWGVYFVERSPRWTQIESEQKQGCRACDSFFFFTQRPGIVK